MDEQAEQVRRLCHYIETNLDSSLTLEDLGQAVHLSPFHLQRIFTKVVGVSPKKYVSQLRAKKLRAELKAGQTVTASLYEAGFGSASGLYEQNPLGMTPSKYRQGGRGMSIGFTIVNSPLGRMIVAATGRGVCFVGFGENDGHLEKELRQDYPAAEIKRDRGFSNWVDGIMETLRGQPPRQTLPVDVQGTAFQQKVWQALQTIPAGETRTYGEIAKQIGQPSAARAVGRACATNHVPIVIPCHRVIGNNGQLTGYRWGTKRKEKLLAKEREG